MYILTGGAGFIGSNILRALNARGVYEKNFTSLEHGAARLMQGE